MLFIGPMGLAPFTFFEEEFGSEIVKIYFEMCQWLVLVAGGGLQVLSMILWIVAASMANVKGLTVYVVMSTLITAGMYAGYIFLFDPMMLYYKGEEVSAKIMQDVVAYIDGLANNDT